MIKKFLRRSSDRYSKLGKRKKKKQIWRKPKGRDNKMREKRRGYPAVVKIGYKNEGHKTQIVIRNLKDLEKVKNQDLVIVGKVGKKKKIEIVKKAKEKGIKLNLNIEKFLEKVKPKEKKGQGTESPTSSKQPNDSSTKESKTKVEEKK